MLNLICGLRLGARRLEPLRGHPGKRDFLGVSDRPTFFSRSVEEERLSNAPNEGSSSAPKPLDPRAGFRPLSSAPRAAQFIINLEGVCSLRFSQETADFRRSKFLPLSVSLLNDCLQSYPRHQNDYMQLFLFSGIYFLTITITITFLNP